MATLPACHELAWDCGAGSGQATLPLAHHFHRVVGTDASAAQIAAAPMHPSIEFRVAPAQTSGLPARTVDLVTVAQALHWFELDGFYTEVRRVLRPDGVIAVWTYGHSELDDTGLDQALRTFYEEVVGPYWPPERRHVENGYEALPFPFIERSTPTFPMELRWTLAELLGYVGTWSAVARFREQRGHDPISLLAQELAPRWGDPASERRVRWPLRLRVGGLS